MTFGAGVGDALRAGGGQRVADGADVMDGMAIHAFGRPLAAGGQRLAVDAGLVLGKLVHARLRLVTAHDIGVAVAAPAVGGDAQARDPQLEAAAGIHGEVLVGFVGVAAVAAVATDGLGEMT